MKLPNITNSVDAVIIGCDIFSDSLVDGRRSDTLAFIPTDNLTRSYPFTFEPRRALYSPVSNSIMSEMRITVKDSLGRFINLNGINWFMTLILRQGPINMFFNNEKNVTQ